MAGTRSIKVFTLQPAKVIVDVTGYFTGSTSEASEVGLFVPVDPVRILDTREGLGVWEQHQGPLAAGPVDDNAKWSLTLSSLS